MTLVLLGTQNNSFHRLLEEVQKNIDNGNIKDEVIVQKGYTKFESSDMKIYDQVSAEKMKELVKQADLIITHGGVGSIITAIEQGKKVIAVPRLKKYKEHAGYIIGIQEVSELPKALEMAKKFIPQKYVQNTGKILQIVSDFIDNH